jgi:hypothetical protein
MPTLQYRLSVGRASWLCVTALRRSCGDATRAFPRVIAALSAERRWRLTSLQRLLFKLMELGLEVPGRFLLVDHSPSRAMDNGALGSLVVSGDERPD